MMQAGQVDKLTGQLAQIVLQRLEAGRLQIPSPPTVVAKCLQILKTPDFQTKKLVTAIEIDPVLVAMLLREASAATHGNSVKAIEPAIARIGADSIKALVIAYAAHELFESFDAKIKAANKKIWEHSVACALLARDLAAFSGNVDGDTCYLAGLLHDVGKPVLASMMLEAERKFGSVKSGWMDHTLWTQAIANIHRKIGVAVATQWNLAPDVTAAIRDCSDYDANDRGCAANVVRLANALAKREGFATEAVVMDDVDAMVMVGRSMLGVDAEVITRLASGLKARVAQAVE
jgi:putative nucleotidyltransferase with HDIG domain